MRHSREWGEVDKELTATVWLSREIPRRMKLKRTLVRRLGAVEEQYLNFFEEEDGGEFTIEVSNEPDRDADWTIQVDAEARARLTGVHLAQLGAEVGDTLVFRILGDGMASVEVIKEGSEGDELPEEFFLPDEVEEGQTYIEGAMKRVPVNAYERNPRARRACLREHGTDCSVCGFSFEKEYGEIGAGYIHVHHLRPLAQAGGEYELNPVEDLRPVCPNCHAMLHKRNPPYSIEELKEILERRRGAA